MALISMRQLLDHAAENDYGVPAFNVNNLEQMRAIMEGADETQSPVIVQASAGARKYAGPTFLRHLIDLAAGFNIFQGVGPSYLGGLMDNEARKAIHWVHRLSAIGVALIVLSLAWRLMRANRLLASAMVVVLIAQIVLGILNVVWVLPLFNATLHNVGGALLLITLVTVNFAPRLRIHRAMPNA